MSERKRREPPEWLTASGSDASNGDRAGAVQSESEKRERARRLRVALCKREMLLGDTGNLNPEYFKAALHADGDEARAWGDNERLLLLRGLEQHGVGAWSAIQTALLPSWKNNELRVKASRLIGRQNLKAYAGWRANAAMLDVERERNKAIADRLRAETGIERWKGNVLVADDDGLVAAAIAASELAQPRAASL